MANVRRPCVPTRGGPILASASMAWAVSDDLCGNRNGPRGVTSLVLTPEVYSNKEVIIV